MECDIMTPFPIAYIDVILIEIEVIKKIEIDVI